MDLVLGTRDQGTDSEVSIPTLMDPGMGNGGSSSGIEVLGPTLMDMSRASMDLDAGVPSLDCLRWALASWTHPQWTQWAYVLGTLAWALGSGPSKDAKVRV